MKSVLILHHLQLVRDVWAIYLNEQKDIHVSGVAEDYREACEMAATLRPCILLIYSDISIVLDRVREIHRSSPLSRMIIVTAVCPESIPRLLKYNGVRGCLSEQSSLKELELAVSKVFEGGMYLSINRTKKVKVFVDPKPAERPALLLLTKREREIAHMIGLGKSSREIAQHLHRSIHTVGTHRRQIFKKLRCDNLVELLYKLGEAGFASGSEGVIGSNNYLYMNNSRGY